MFNSLSLLAAVAKTTNAAATNTAAAVEHVTSVKTTLADWIIQGGVMMIPLILASIIVVAIVIERFVFFRRVRLENIKFMDKINRVIGANRLMEAMVICDNTPAPMAAIVKTGLTWHDRGREEVKQAIEETAAREVNRLERYLPILGTIGTVGPLLGLLGTVLGMIKSSNILAMAGTSSPVGLIAGISEALVTTAAGLCVAIPAVVSHNWFIGRVNTIVNDMEEKANDLVELLARTKPAAKGRTQGGGERT